MVEKIVINSDIQNINTVEKLIDDISVKFDLHADVYGKLSLAVVEGVNNAIVHGNKLNHDLLVSVSYQLTETKLIFSIEDSGSGFDFTTIPDPTLPENIEKSHGRGIFLMKHLSDELDFENEGRLVKLTFNLHD
ncbi:ATP-binding protein [Saccharicrinis aurantiacus]|uniref:ATP-binding protein n=1 Tax=Saccharicrinis aurantiacus TaxID=1849719 RepID=UPI0009501FA8|nr:ATP-binding protein [Saccharicrinis aurantiacus]